MAKDPAFLFYPGDWLGGTMLFTRHHKGAYMDILMAQFNNGHMSEKQIKIVLGKDDEHLWEEVLKSKFVQDEAGNYYNQKLDNEINKRRKFTQSRKDNLQNAKNKDNHMDSHMDKHMENENENVIVIDIKKGGVGEKIDFIDRIVHSFKEQYENVNNIDYIILNKGKEREAAGKLLSQYKKRHPEADSEQTLTALESYFAACVRIKDGWYRDNMSLPIIISKFNAINKILRDGKSRTNPGISDQEFSELIKSM
jgi:uncharacterized protein YdaU (DUF1376 family)